MIDMQPEAWTKKSLWAFAALVAGFGVMLITGVAYGLGWVPRSVSHFGMLAAVVSLAVFGILNLWDDIDRQRSAKGAADAEKDGA